MCDTKREPADRHDVVLAIAAGLLGLLSRLAFLFGAPDRSWPHSILYEGDAPVWVTWARALDRGQAFEFDLPLRTPGVAFLLHWLSPGEIGAPFLGWKIAWCLLSAVTCGVAYLAFRRIFDRRVSLIATTLLVFSYGSLLTATSLNNEAPYTLLLVGIVWATLVFNARPLVVTAATLGVLHGLATLLRAEHTLLLLLMVAMSGWVVPRRIRTVPVGERSLRPATSAILVGVIPLVSIVVCLPWTLRGSAALARFNETSSSMPDYARARPPWTPEAQAALDALPAFARDGNFRFITALAQQSGRADVTSDDVDRFFETRFGYVPEPVSAWMLVSSKGPLDFALANHPDADGGFSRAALRDGMGPDPPFSFARPSHLKLYNHGVSVGIDSIADDPGRWLGLVGKKLRNFGDGVTLGLTSLDLPCGRAGVRRRVDLATPDGAACRIWKPLVLLLLVAGLVVATRRRAGGVWMVIILYKLLVTILFYGYARQAVSIQPAFAIFAALAIDAALAAGAARVGPGGRRSLPLLGGVVVVSLLAVDLIGSRVAREVDVRTRAPAGQLTVDDDLAPGALLSHDELEVRVARPPGR